MFINPAILKAATFLVINNEPCSTVFFVRFPFEDSSYAYYAITTKHSLKNPVVSIEFNKKGGGIESQWFNHTDWTLHPSTDVAVLPLEESLTDYDIEYIDVRLFAHSQATLRKPVYPPGPVFLNDINAVNIGDPFPLPYNTGDAIFSVGLFRGHMGQHLAQPVARFGHIALNPGEGEKIFADIEAPNLTPIDAILVEMAVWQGQSGSPVFLHEVSRPEARMFPQIVQEGYWLIGMIQGFYPGKQNVKINEEDATLSSLQMGIGIVIPAKDIIEALMQETLKEQRERLKNNKQ